MSEKKKPPKSNSAAALADLRNKKGAGGTALEGELTVKESRATGWWNTALAVGSAWLRVVVSKLRHLSTLSSMTAHIVGARCRSYASPLSQSWAQQGHEAVRSLPCA